MSYIGKNIKIAREKAGITQDELAQRTGYKDRSAIAKIETGTNDVPGAKVSVFAQALNVSVFKLLETSRCDQ